MTDAKDQKTTPVPANANPAPAPAPVPSPPSPLQIGTAFIKQYYQVLSTNPSLITRFYKPNSVISHSLVPSAPAEPKTLSELTKASEGEDDQIFQWCRSKENKNGICFDFGRGAIDAHNTINGGILLVATGHMTLPSDEKEQDGTGMKKFVQTFLLNNGSPAGKKRQFYVHNDVLRVLDAGVEAGKKEAEVVAKDEVAASDAPEAEKDAPDAVAVAEEKEAVPVEDAAVESKSDAKDDVKAEESTASKEEVAVDTKVAETPANGKAKATPVVSDGEEKKIDKQAVKEESTKETSNGKSDVEAEKSSTAAGSNAKSTKPEEKKSNAKSTSEKKGDSGNQEKKGRKNKSRGRSRKSRSSSPTEGNDGKKSEGVPGSWASLVAGGSGPSAVAAAAASAAAKITKDEKKNAPAADSTADDSKDAASSSAVSEKRKPDSAGKPSKNDSGSASTDQQQKQQQQQSKKVIAAQRTPEATILIKNIPDKTKEGEIRIMFEPYAAKLQKKILGITLLASRGFCFVDFDSKVVVDEIVKIVEAEKAAAAKDAKNNKEGGNNSFASKLFMINGKPLDVGRKVPDSKAGSGGRGRGFRRSASPGNNRAGGYNKNNRGGRKGSPRDGTKPVNKK